MSLYYAGFPRKQSLRQGLNTKAPLGEKTQLLRVRERGSEVGKDGKQIYKDVLLCCPLIAKMQKTKLVTLQIHVLRLSRQLQTPIPCFPTVCPRERKEGMYFLDCSCSP